MTNIHNTVVIDETKAHERSQPLAASEYPRTLIVGSIFSQYNSTGIYLAQIFSSWPKEALACATRIISPPDFSHCIRFYQLGTLEFVPPPLVGAFLPRIRSGPIPESVSCSYRQNISASANHPNNRLIQIRSRVRRLLGGGDILYRARGSRQLLDWIKDFNPEVMYGQCSTLTSAQFLNRIQQITGLPLVLHCMDDFAEGHYRAGWSKALDGYLYRKEFHRLMQSASCVIGICKEMAQEYQTRYARPITWIDMPANLSRYKTVRRTEWHGKKEFRIRYGGRVGWGIRACLAEFATAVHELRQEGYPIVFDVVKTNSGAVPEACFRAAGVRILPPEPYAQLPSALANADALLICYDFDEQSYRQARFSMPSKLPECMASGTPIIVYGPTGLPVVEYAKSSRWGKVVDQHCKEHLKSAILDLYNSETERECLASNAMHLAFNQHDSTQVSEQLRAILSGTLKSIPSHPVTASSRRTFL